MATSKIQIWNMALSSIGQKKFIQSDVEASIEADWCRLHWDNALRSTLSTFPWKFARARVDLSLTNDEVYGWAYCYAYPSDCIRALSLVKKDQPVYSRSYSYFNEVASTNQDIPFDIMLGENDSKIIVTNDPDAELQYTKYISNPVRWDHQFVEAMSHRLATLIAMPITTKAGIAQLAAQNFNLAINAAIERSGNEGESKADGPSDYERARY